MQTKSDEHESKGKRKISHLLISEAIHYLCIFGKLMAVNFNDWLNYKIKLDNS